MERGKRKFSVGIVVSDKCDKTRQVSVDRVYRHKLYGKVLRTKRKFAVHDEQNISKLGDTVKIMESRPMSKTKKWILAEVIQKVQ
ncbi:MAG: 30S ribosomal protein S17 [Elusimicrobiota bacterium]|nr:30S ribosomal protein S17 [Elusimicrobiota bacterium]